MKSSDPLATIGMGCGAIPFFRSMPFFETHAPRFNFSYGFFGAKGFVPFSLSFVPAFQKLAVESAFVFAIRRQGPVNVYSVVASSINEGSHGNLLESEARKAGAAVLARGVGGRRFVQGNSGTRIRRGAFRLRGPRPIGLRVCSLHGARLFGAVVCEALDDYEVTGLESVAGGAHVAFLARILASTQSKGRFHDAACDMLSELFAHCVDVCAHAGPPSSASSPRPRPWRCRAHRSGTGASKSCARAGMPSAWLLCG